MRMRRSLNWRWTGSCQENKRRTDEFAGSRRRAMFSTVVVILSEWVVVAVVTLRLGLHLARRSGAPLLRLVLRRASRHRGGASHHHHGQGHDIERHIVPPF